MMQLESAWRISTGSSSITVGIIDSGIDASCSDLEGVVNVDRSRVFSNGTCETVNEVVDVEGHGTNVAGIIGAIGYNDVEIQGVCRDVSLVSLRAFNEDRKGTSYNVALAINYAENEGIPILNLSAGFYASDTQHYNRPLESVIRNFSGLVVCAAGNEGFDNNTVDFYPSNYKLPNLISVGASNPLDERWTYTLTSEGVPFTLGSNYGSTMVDIFAPGQYIWTTKKDG